MRYYCLLLLCLPHLLFSQSKVSTADQPCDTIQRVIVRDTTSPSLVRFGASVEYALPFVSADFSGLPGVATCCPQYRPLSASGFGVGVFGEIPLLARLGIGARLGLSSFSMNFSERKNVLLANALTIGSPLSVPLLYSLSTSISAFSLEPYIFYRPLPMMTIRAGVGLTTLFSGTYSQSERLDTTGLVFSNLRAERNVLSGAMSKLASILPSVSVGVNYEIPFGDSGQWLVAPEASFSLSLGNLVNDLQGANASWTMSAARVGVSVRYSPERTTPLSNEEMRILQERENQRYEKRVADCKAIVAAPQVVSLAKQFNISAKITDVRGIKSDGSVVENPTITIEEFLASRSRYVLNNIFFGLSSADIAPRYERIRAEESAGFRFENFTEAGVLQIYYHVLNIVGKRLTQNPKADITLIGHADGLTEKNDKRLAQARAEKIKEYLVNAWGIAESRIKTQTALSRTPTGTDGDELLEAEEQRRVEIQSNNRMILEELRFDYFVRVIEPAKIRLTFDISSNAGIGEWSVVAKQHETNGTALRTATERYKRLFAKRGTSSDEKILEWEIAKSEHLPQSREPIEVELRAASSTDANSPVVFNTTVQTIPVTLVSVADKERQRVADRRTDSYTLFSFAYGTNAPISGNADVQRVVAAIKQTLKPGAQVTVSGYTDTRGNEITNGILAQQRANAVAGLIAFPNMIINSFGATKINDNALPEGRFYNRFVQVDVQTPLR
jgi:outer membrane protein OmpA-like peptidoglycan-associated protein